MSSSLQRGLMLVLCGVCLAGVVRGQVVTEFPLPGVDARIPVDIAAGPDGNLWFVEYASNSVGRITRAGVVTEFPLPTAQSRPSGIAAGLDGNLWFTQNASAGNNIGRITTAGDITEFSIPTASSGPFGIAAGLDGNLWFTEASANKIGRISTTGVVTEFSIPTANGGPLGITAGPDGNLWFTETDSSRRPFDSGIGRVTPTGIVTTFEIPPDSSPLSIAAGPDGNLWFTEFTANAVGRMTTEGVLTGTFPLPEPGSFPIGIAAGPDGALWFTEGESRIGRITTSGVITEFSTPFGGGFKGQGIAAGPDGNVWFTENSRIGRIGLGSAGLCVANATTLCLSGGRFQVRAEWQIPSQGASGPGTAVPLMGNTGAFWFFDPKSIEVVVRVLDGCSLNGHLWVFVGGLTNVGATLTVTDTQTDVAKTYTNPTDTAFRPIQDTAAFSTCP